MDFAKLAECAAKVVVGGQEVSIRPPSAAARRASSEFARRTQDGGDDLSLGDKDVLYLEYMAEVMADMVVTDPPVSAENWSRIIQIRAEHEHGEDIERLMDAVRRLLYGPEVADQLNSALKGDAAVDLVDEAADDVGKSASTSPGP